MKMTGTPLGSHSAIIYESEPSTRVAPGRLLRQLRVPPLARPAVTTNTSVTSPGCSLAVYCENSAPRERTSLTLYSDVVNLSRTTSDDNGSCFTFVTIPSNTRAGVHTIVAKGQPATLRPPRLPLRSHIIEV